ncbi:MAG: DUF6265 family protein [Blastocatellia bacterium]|nr:DUF6265 family protein [Blastocatellia bacterium]
MMRKIRRAGAATILAAIFFLCGNPVAGTAQDNSGKKPSLADLDWMVGRWEGKALGGDVEEHWTRAAGGSMVGMFRLVKGEKTPVLEFFIIAEEDGGVVYRFKHFSSKMVAWEEKPLFYRLVELTGERALFESQEIIPGKPSRLIYNKTGADSLVIEVGDKEKGGFLLNMKRAGRPAGN